MTIKKFIRFISRPATIKIVAGICMLGFFFILPVFAGGDTTNGTNKTLVEGLNTFISVCSRLRVILAILAGKLMTNDFVYGAFLHMDIYLWKIRNIMKNFANFALAGMVLRSIIKSLSGKEAIDVKKIITNTLIAGILIQASRFLMGAVIDISTVATAGISGFPTAFLKSDAGLQNQIKDSITNFKANRTIIDLNNSKNPITSIPETANTQTSDDLRQNILPTYNSVSGPFVYLGMGVFHFQDYLSVATSSTDLSLTLGFTLRFLILFFFTVGLLFLLIANIMRVGLIRVFVIGSPFLILVQVFKPKEGGGGIMKLLSLSNLIAIVFKPVIFVIGMSLMLIVIVSMQKSITGSGANRESNLNGVVLSTTGTNTSTLTLDGISNISVSQTDLLGKDTLKKDTGVVQNFFSYIVMLLLTLFIMRRFVKLSLTLGGGPIEKTMEGLLKHAEGLATTMPILPLAGGTSLTAASKFSEQSKKKLAESAGINTRGEFGQLEGQTFRTNEGKFDSWMSQKLGGQEVWEDRDWAALKSVANSNDPETYKNFFGKSAELANERQGGLSIATHPAWVEHLQTVLSNSNKARDLGFQGTLQKKDDEGMKNFFTGNNLKIFYDKMGGTASGVLIMPKNYDELKKATFYANKK